MKHKLVFISISILTILFCSAIALDISPLLRGPAPYPPDWRWDYLFINTLSKVWAPIVCMSLMGLVMYKIESISEKLILLYEKRILFLFVLLSVLLQFSLLYFSRSGIGVLVQRIINPDMNGYFTAALSLTNIGEFLHSYNDLVLTLPMHAQGHPPGAILFFWGLLHLLEPFSGLFSFLNSIIVSHSDVAVLWNDLSLNQKFTSIVSGGLISVLSALSIPLIYFIGKSEHSVRVGIRSAMLYLCIPSVLFFIPINDVFLPLFSLSAFLFFITGLKKQKKWLLFLSGMIFSFGIFFSLSLLPLLLLFFLYALFQKRTIRELSVYGFEFVTGFLLLPSLLFLFLGYDTLEVSKTLMSGLPQQRSYLTWVLYNLYDFFIFAGIPVCIFTLMLAKESIWVLRKRKNRTVYAIAISFFIMLLLLNFSGSVRGEVARIWMPYYSFLVIIVGFYITQILKIHKTFFIGIIFLQCLQILFMQEFWVMLW